MAVNYVPAVKEKTFKERISSYISVRLPNATAKIINAAILGFVKVFRFVMSLVKEAFNK